MEIPNPVAKTQAEPFPLSQVRLLDGPFRHAQELDGKYLLALEPDRFLHNFREFAGLKPKGKVYGGWESRGLAGHTLGHYLTACAEMYASTGDARYKARVDDIVSELSLCQSKRSDGYVAAIPDGDRIWQEVSAGNIQAQSFSLNGGWVPWYNLHKLYAGLIDAYIMCGSEEAKNVVTRLGEWAVQTTGKLDDAQWQKMLVAEHGGMNEAMADLYAITGEPEFLKLARRFHDDRVLDPLAQGEDRLTGLHANTQIPKVIGLARQYELTGDESMRTGAEFFWKTVVEKRSYVIGGNSDREHFFPPNQFDRHLGPQTAESCNTYNMLKLTRHLFSWEPSAAGMDFYERALYNHILASQDPEKGMMTYFVSMKPGHFKVYNTPDDSFWCCTGSGMENHAKYGESIYYRHSDSLFVNLFIPSVLTWEEKGLTVRQETRFPEQDTTKLTLTGTRPVPLTLKIRYPAWAQGMTLSVNGKPETFTATPGSYVSLSRTWKPGDTVDVRLPMSLHLEPLPNSPKTVAVLYGPIVLAGALGTANLPDLYLPDHTQLDTLVDPHVPVLVGDPAKLLQGIVPVAGKPLTFQTKGLGKPDDLTLIPFYRMHHQRYSVYWDTFTPGEWQEQEARLVAAEAERKAVEARTLDEVRPGEQQPEVDHYFQGESTQSGNLNGRAWRDARNGGWFSYDLKVMSDTPQVLRCTYWGDDAGGREFDLLVDGVKVAAQTLERNRPGTFFTVDYPIPAEQTHGKSRVTVRFQAHTAKTAGGLFGCLMLKSAE